MAALATSKSPRILTSKWGSHASLYADAWTYRMYSDWGRYRAVSCCARWASSGMFMYSWTGCVAWRSNEKVFLEDSWENEKFSILIFFIINVHQLHVPLKYFLILVVDCPRILSWCEFLSKVFLSFSETVLFVLPIWSKKKGKQGMKFKQLSWNIKQYGKGRERYKERQSVAISRRENL